MKIPSLPKQRILIKSLRKQLTLLVKNLDEFPLSPPQVYRFIIDAIVFPHAAPNP